MPPLIRFGFVPVVVMLWACASAFAEVVVRDPGGRLEALHRQLGRPRWENAVVCGERKTFLRTVISCESKCSSLSCITQCAHAEPADKTFDLAVEDCSERSVSIYGTNNLALTLDRADFERTGTWIVPLLAGFGHFIQPVGEIEVTFGFPKNFLIFEQGRMRRELGYQLFLEHRVLPGTMAQQYDIGFLPGRSLLDSLVMVTDGTGDVFLKREGVSYAQ